MSGPSLLGGLFYLVAVFTAGCTPVVKTARFCNFFIEYLVLMETYSP